MSRPLRLLRAAVLLGFAGLVAKLFASGEMAKYMSPSLDPLTALAGLLLGAMGLAELRATGRSGDEPAEGSDEQALTLVLLVLPLVLGLTFSPRALGSAALGGEGISRLLLSFGGGDAPPATAAPPAPARPIADFGDLLAYLGQYGDRAVGQRVQVVGLPVRDARMQPDEVGLLRFQIVHCVADARPIAVLVVAPAGAAFSPDQWVRIEGVLAAWPRDGDRLVTVTAETVTPVDEPGSPYLSAI